ncbi:putative tyrosine phosphatase protein [Phaeoacremonium minimum UCRPA7]|uniref:Putative tyrosine phosphatase protein n=1 Tax=Phaeoacremonium minimum (strain UCR-PA7) TaxID=1286976 RepID=R8BVR1_PHAM7|nr:putative tyrosine phosphatase protein [Phaeoacremonium minimum UCRPA7]EOO03481.1 putative tyrosine phosphatase protein [Phaeoacremonium minimum UCRPA7]
MAADLRALAEIDVVKPIPKGQLYATLETPPFIFVPGTYNTRDVGLVPGVTRIRPGLVFRSGGLDRLTDNGKALIQAKLGVKRVFDLRSQREHETAPDPEIDGVVNVWNVDVGEDDAKVNLSTFIDGEGEKGYTEMYLDVLRLYRPAFRDVLEHVRDRPTGRDRTGVLAGLLLTLAGESSDAIELDFLLSRVGTEPVREHLLAFAKRGARIESEDEPGFYNLASLKAVCWRAFVEALDKEYGGFDGYITKTLGFSEEDLAKIKKNLVRDEGLDLK